MLIDRCAMSGLTAKEGLELLKSGLHSDFITILRFLHREGGSGTYSLANKLPALTRIYLGRQ